MKRILHSMKRRKKSWTVGAVLVVGGGFLVGQSMGGNAVVTRYVLAAAERGTLMTSVTGSGQVQGEVEFDVSPDSSGKVLRVDVQNGQHVDEGDVIAVLDSADAAKTVRNARLNLANAQLSMQKLLDSVDSLTLLQAQNDLAQAERDLTDLEDGPDDRELQTAKDAVTKAERNLAQAERDLVETKYDSEQSLLTSSENGYNSVGEAFTDLSVAISDLSDLVGTSASEFEYVGYYRLLVGPSFTEGLVDDYEDARDSYNAAWLAYQDLDHDSSTDDKIDLINQTLAAGKDIADTLIDARTLLNQVESVGYDTSAIADHIDDMITAVPSNITKINSRVSSLQSTANSLRTAEINAPNDIADAEYAVEDAKSKLADAKADLIDLTADSDSIDVAIAKENVAEKKQRLADLQAGPDEIELNSQRLTLQDRQNSLNDALEAYTNCTVRAPISGTVANLSAQVGQKSSGTVATVIADRLTATVSLNEIDVAGVKAGNKVTSTFDAVEDLIVTGTVKEVDPVGSVSSGVVNYGVLITFDTQDERIRSGMSVSVTVVTQVKQGALYVPSSAIKSQGDVSYVEVLDGVDAAAGLSSQGVTSDTAPRQVQVEVGLSNDTSTEILSGLDEGGLVVTRTVTDSSAAGSTAAALRSTTPSLLGNMGGGAGQRGGGFAPRD
ncbi:hypothetical protein COY93_02560 [Candidatus Uhrbacteria bacterium CG_4_10_14_0_8_um_filter_58_22]|uniref:Uncharacterized protein n=1 Tax=Candidatus Uhrbacteria bacterium CG_4_10_14_0_8_um_filter_58_22 TaxID=1975029 RepID=A0A2M7Q9Y3_9BACT|nr:MAG: hypothetical protein COY93_02560 [Candidatus Uhrbacteria bacterium CG_4_10_14_0_8_um_filter_58_22]